MEKLLAVGAGGCLGALLRYGVVTWIPRWPLTDSLPIPLGVLFANLLGCMLVGALRGISESLHVFNETSSLFLFTGLLGGFTTFSAFSMETIDLLQRGQFAGATIYVGVSVVAGILLAWTAYVGCCHALANP